MVQKSINELGDSTKQSDRSDSAETAATEQIETTALEIVHEAVQLPRHAIQHSAHRKSEDSSAGVHPERADQPRRRAEIPRTRSESRQSQSVLTPTPQEQERRAYVRQAKKTRAEQPSARDHLHTGLPEIRLADDMPQSVLPPIREKPTFTELRGEPHPEPTPENASNVQHIKQPGAWTPRKEALPITRSKGQTIRERPAVTQAHDLPPVPQAQARQAFVEKQAQLSQNPSIHPNRLPLFCRSRLFRKHPQLRRSVSRSRLAAVNRLHPSSRQHRHKLHQWNSPPPSVKSRSQAPHRGKDPGAAFPFGQWIRNKSARQR